MSKALTINLHDFSKLSNQAVVMLPLAEFERMQEDLEMLRSTKLPRRVAQARADIKAGTFVTLDEIKQQAAAKA